MTGARLLERALRALAIAAIAWLLWSSLRPAAAGRVVVVRAGAIDSLGPSLARDRGVVAVHARLDSSPTRSAFDLLRALRRAGVETSWEGSVPALAIGVVPVPEPGGATRIALAAPGGVRATVSDAVGFVDSLVVGGRRAGGGAELVSPLIEPPVRGTVGAYAAEQIARDSLVARPVLVIGAAGWESKFVVAALEEAGWRVAARLALGAGLSVGQGSGSPIDTAHFAAVVALDSTAASSAAALRRFVRSGGGLVLAGRAASSAAALDAIAPARVGRSIATRPSLVADSIAPNSVARAELAGVRQQGVVLARHGAQVMAAARREGAGRVVQVGVEESWRWRMEGAPGSEEAHRRWWSRLVASVAHAPPAVAGAPNDARETALPSAPLAATMEALGAPRPARVRAAAFDPLRHRWILVLVLGALLAEWFSRRLRGAR